MVQGPYTDAQIKMTGQTFCDSDPSDAPSAPITNQKSFNTLQQQYDDIPSPPKKESFRTISNLFKSSSLSVDDEAPNDEDLPIPPTAPPDVPGFAMDDDLSHRLAELRKR